MKFTLTIETGNAAYVREEDDGMADGLAVADEVRKVANLVADGFRSGKIRDPLNGSVVGSFELSDG